MPRLSIGIDLLAPGQDTRCLPRMPLRRGHKFQAAVLVHRVVPPHKFQCPRLRRLQTVERFVRIIWPVLAGAEERFGVRDMLSITYPVCCRQRYVARGAERRDPQRRSWRPARTYFLEDFGYTPRRNVINDGKARCRKGSAGCPETSTLASAFAFISRSTSA